MPRKKTGSRSGKTDLAQKAYQDIRRMLFYNEIIPGQKIACSDLAERLGMSVTPIVQALKWLEFQGLVRHEPNRGYFTEPVSVKEVEEIYDLRKVIEVSLLPETLKRIDPAGIERLRASLETHLQAVHEVYLSRRLLTDMAFHLTLAELSGSTIPVKTLRHLFDLLYLKYRGNVLFVTSMKSADTEHRQIFDAVASKDLPRAAEALGRHLAHVKDHVASGLERMLEEQAQTRF